MKTSFLKESFSDKLYDIITRFLVIFAVVICVYPFVYVISISLSSGIAVNQGRVWLYPVDIDLSTFGMVMLASASRIA